MTDTSVEVILELNRRAWEMRTFNPRQALDLAQQAAGLAGEIDDKAGLAFAHRNRGVCLWLLAEHQSSLNDLVQALHLYRELGDSHGEAVALNWIGNCFWRMNRFQAALDYHNQALELRLANNDRAGQAISYSNLGVIYVEQGLYAEALEAYYQTLSVGEQLNDKELIALASNNLGDAFVRLKDYQKALSYYLDCLRIREETNNQVFVSQALFNLGEVYKLLQAYDRAMENLQRGLDIACELGVRDNQALCLLQIGDVQELLGHSAAAIDYYNQALEITRQIGDEYNEVEVLIKQGELFNRLKQPAEAFTALQRALELGENFQTHEFIFKTHLALSEAYELQGDYAAALQEFKAFHTKREALFGVESDRKIKEVLVRIETERARREAELYRAQNLELARAYSDLQQVSEQVSEEVHKLQDKALELQRQAREDPVTGLFNRRYLEAEMIREFERARRQQAPLALVMIDVDDFKQVNDTYSHPLGDEVLKLLAGIFHANSRAGDLVARFGGEEFTLILPGASELDAYQLCERIRLDVQNYPWDQLQPGLKVTISLGVSGNETVPSADAILAMADARLYQAKNRGKNCTV